MRTRERNYLLINKLTPTELKVKELLVNGFEYNEIAKELIISPTTVKTHVNHLFVKLDVSNRASLIVNHYKNILSEKPRIFLKEYLTDIEKDVLQRFSIGLNLYQISDCVKLSPLEVRDILQSFFNKLEI